MRVCACVCCTIGQAKARAALRISAFSQLPSCLRSWLLMAEGVVDVPAAAVAVAAAYAVLDMFRLPTPLPLTATQSAPASPQPRCHETRRTQGWPTCHLHKGVHSRSRQSREWGEGEGGLVTS